jgi:hypothetical protein
MAAVFIMGLPVTLLLWTTGRLFVLHIRFVQRLARLRFIYSPSAYMSRVRPLLRLGVIASLTWSLGVGLFVILLGHVDRMQFALLSGVGVIGAAGFVLPLITFVAKLAELRNERHDSIAHLILDSMREPPTTRNQLLELISLEEQLQASDRLSGLLIEWRYLVYILITFVIPVCVNIVAAKIGAWMG